LVTEFLEDMITKRTNIFNDETDEINLDYERIHNTPVEELLKEDKIELVFALFKQL